MNAASLIVSIASFVVSLAALFIARSSLKQAEQVAEQNRRDWQQRKWFDLYFKANEVSDSLEHFQTSYRSMSATLWGMPDVQRDFNELMFLVRRVHSMAAVFPKHRVIDDLFKATDAFGGVNAAMLPDRLQAVRDAVEALRQKAVVDATILE